MGRKLWIVVVIVMGLLPSVAASQSSAERGVEQRPGLMWQNTGLPAVFPLQVKTRSGRNYYLQLLHPETREPSLAAFIEGGKYFKVLVPPGRFRVLIFAGRTWQGEELYFGQGALTEVIELADPLTFRTRGLSTKAGHLIDLRELGSDTMAAVSVKAQFICQTLGIAPVPPRSAVFGPFHSTDPVRFGRAGHRDRQFWYLAHRRISATVRALEKQHFLDTVDPHAIRSRLIWHRPMLRVRTRVC